ncbi:hypothetical protein GCM10010304_17320 [Streptomyces roseoviolaceus]
MHAEIRVATDDGGETITDLYSWLRQDRDLRRHVDVRRRAPRQTGGAMGVLDIVDVVFSGVSTASGVAAFALSYISWRRAHPRSPEVTITVNGMPITFRNADEETVSRVVERLHAANGGTVGRARDTGEDSETTGTP